MALFLRAWKNWRSTRSLRNAGGMKVAQFPGGQNAQEQQNRKTDAKRQRPSHAAVAALTWRFLSASPHHEEQRCTQTANDGHKSHCHKEFHVDDYRVERAVVNARFLVLTLAAAAGVLVTASLGMWQLSRAVQKQAMQSDIDARRQMAPLDGSVLAGGPADTRNRAGAVHRRVVVRGHWLAAHTVYLDNRQMGGRQGFYVLTPLELEGRQAVVIVQRGWVPRNFSDRQLLPVIDTPTGLVTVEGRIAPAPGRLYGTSDGVGGAIRQNLDLSAFAVEIRRPLLEVTVLQTDAAAGGLLRQWPDVATGVEKHRGYAFQWFALAGLIGLLYVWFQIVRPYLRARQSV